MGHRPGTYFWRAGRILERAQVGTRYRKGLGRIAKWDRSGRTLRTPTFTLDQGVVHYLIRGKGMVYAVVDSHRMINGPLHGNLVKTVSVDINGEPQWIGHGLQRYLGHGLHLEFIPEGNDPFEVYAVVQGNARARFENVPVGNALLAKLESPESLESVTASLADSISAALLSVNKPSDDAGQNQLGSWIAGHPECFVEDTAPLQAIVDRHRRVVAELQAKVQQESRTAMAMWDGNAADETLLVRGNVKTPGDRVPRGSLEALSGPRKPLDTSGSGRLDLAESLVADDNPLTRRVIVNRIWHHLFGVGIVPSVDNFGVLGKTPSHPKLLDYLAVKFAKDGWSIKRMIRFLMLSDAYQMSSEINPAAIDSDPKTDCSTAPEYADCRGKPSVMRCCTYQGVSTERCMVAASRST